jgi:sigma-B regulation protein RsbU (phosphoserine phosphatase)
MTPPDVAGAPTATLSLAPDPQAAGRARRFLADSCPDGVDPAICEIGQLLVSELVTNAVVHAASAVDLEVGWDETGLTVRVRDADTGPLVGRAGGASELDEGGRGFLLVDRLADRWGTEHQRGRKTVWFQLGNDAAPAGTPPATEAAPAATAPDALPASRRLATLVLRPTVREVLSFDEQVGELLARIRDAVGATGASLTLTGEATPVASRGEMTTSATTEFDLVADDRKLGRLAVCADRAFGADDTAFLRLAADRLALLAVEHGVLRTEQSRVADNDFLSETAELLAGSTSVSLSLTLLTQIVVPRLADWSAAFLVDDRNRPRRVTANHRLEDRTDAVYDVIDGDRELQQAILGAAAGQPAQRVPVTVFVGGQRSHVAVLPLASRSRVLGVLALGSREPLDPVMFLTAVELARRAALAVDNARLHEQQAATVRALQSSLLPSALPTLPRLELAARYHSASPGMSVGGDFYDAVSLDDGSVVLAIGDVCGKGAEAAAVTGMSRDLLRVLVQDGLSPPVALRRLNRALLEHPSTSRFCTVALTQLAWDGQDLRASLCLAGHPEPALLRTDGTTELVGTPGDLLGVLDDNELELSQTEVALQPGDALILYTDGITERREGRRMFGQAGLRKTLTANAGASADALASALEMAAASFVDVELRDDLAVLVIKRVE